MRFAAHFAKGSAIFARLSGGNPLKSKETRVKKACKVKIGLCQSLLLHRPAF
jgi:hypothetical protein